MLRDFAILTDATADLTEELAGKLKIRLIPMTVTFQGEEKVYSTNDKEFMTGGFYARMAAGGIATTAQINTFQFVHEFEKVLKSGLDVLYLGFSSQLSGTFESALEAAKILKSAYPQSAIAVIDTLAASAGQGLLVLKAARLKEEGMNIEQVCQWVLENRQFLSSWMTVDDLTYLKRGGRISTTEAFVGGMLNVKPIIHLNTEGKLLPLKKVRGRKQALKTLVDVMSGFEPGYGNQEIFIAHGNCEKDAFALAEVIKETYAPLNIVITFIGPIIGAHTGPGALALFFFGNHRTVQGVK